MEANLESLIQEQAAMMAEQMPEIGRFAESAEDTAQCD